MERVRTWGLGAVEFVEAAANRRAGAYRDRAAQLAALADAELIGSIRDQLWALATRYHDLAASLELTHPERQRPKSSGAIRAINRSKSHNVRSGNGDETLSVSPAMIDAFEKADRWRSRAAELRIIADAAHQQEVRSALLDMADSFEHHARALTEMAITLRCAGPVFREDATAVVASAAD